MGAFPELFSQIAESKQLDSRLFNKTNVGIFGSFEEKRKTKLNKIKNFLLKHQFDAKISSDFECSNPKKPTEDIDTYNGRMSDLLLRWSDIHIFIFFFELDGEHNLNSSTYREVTSLGKKPVLVIFEEGALDQQRTLFRRDLKNFRWTHHTSSNLKKINDVCLQYCINRVMGMRYQL
jgi:hypothetical protein